MKLPEHPLENEVACVTLNEVKGTMLGIGMVPFATLRVTRAAHPE